MRPLDPRLLRYARATRVYLAVTVVLGVAGAALIVAQATLLASVITAAFLHGADVRSLTPELVWLTVVVAGRAALGWLQEVTAARAAAGVKSSLRSRLFNHLVLLGPAHSRGTGTISILIGRGLDALDGYFARYLPQLVLAVVIPLIIFLRLVPEDLVAAATIAFTLPLIPLFMALVGMHTAAANRRQFHLLSRLGHHFLDVVAGLATLKLHGRARAQADIIRHISDRQRSVTMRTLRTAFLSSLVLELLATVSVALVAVGVGLRLVSGNLDLSTALLILLLAPEAYQPLRQLGTNYHASAEGLAAAEEAFAVLETAVPPDGTAAAPAGGTICFEDVEVRYPGRQRPALRLDTAISTGEFVALTGPSGCGKSTALAVLLGFVVPTSGRVTVDGVPLAAISRDAWSRRVGWLPQRPYLFAGTIADNITFGAAGDPAPAAERACTDSLSRTIGDAGAGLSAGQRQRVALARVLHRDASLVLLDEPTASLDAGTAGQIMTAIRTFAAGRTVIMAAHRPELIALADREIRLVAV